jgi:hypothetical protein
MNKTHLSWLLLFWAILLIGSACEREVVLPDTPADTNPISYYLHLSHTRTPANPTVIAPVDAIDFRSFEMLWLGGDLAWLSSENDATMSYLDSIFQFGSPNTLWSLGNHDYSDLARVTSYTHRPNYYCHSHNGITVMVLDTQDSLSSILGAQKTFFDSVLDTLEQTTHLVILHHKLFWMPGNAILEPMIPTVSNGSLGSCYSCVNPNNFYTDLYPRLLEVHAKGIEVICVGGDIGAHTTTFEYETSEGIHFLASGMSETSSENKAILFRHDRLHQRLVWNFYPIALL